MPQNKSVHPLNFCCCLCRRKLTKEEITDNSIYCNRCSLYLDARISGQMKQPRRFENDLIETARKLEAEYREERDAPNGRCLIPLTSDY